jgi:hypothetical protein
MSSRILLNLSDRKGQEKGREIGVMAGGDSGKCRFDNVVAERIYLMTM